MTTTAIEFAESHSSLDLLGAIITIVPVEALHPHPLHDEIYGPARNHAQESNTYWPKSTKFRLRQYEQYREIEAQSAKARKGDRTDLRKNSSGGSYDAWSEVQRLVPADAERIAREQGLRAPTPEIAREKLLETIMTLQER